MDFLTLLFSGLVLSGPVIILEVFQYGACLLIGCGILLGFLWAIGMIACEKKPDKFEDP